jgi:hypothetical protein
MRVENESQRLGFFLSHPAGEISSDSLRFDVYNRNELVLKTCFALVERSRRFSSFGFFGFEASSVYEIRRKNAEEQSTVAIRRMFTAITGHIVSTFGLGTNKR